MTLIPTLSQLNNLKSIVISPHLFRLQREEIEPTLRSMFTGCSSLQRVSQAKWIEAERVSNGVIKWKHGTHIVPKFAFYAGQTSEAGSDSELDNLEPPSMAWETFEFPL